MLLLAVIFGACGGSFHSSPENTYQDARLKFQRGELKSAFDESDRAYRRYSLTRPQWAWRFRTLKAEILVWRGLSKDALALLNPELPSSLAGSDIAVRRLMIQGLADCFLQRFDAADQHISEAERLAKDRQPDLVGEVVLSRGTLGILRDDYPAAKIAFQEALKLAQENHQSFLQANSLGSLGLVAMRQEHYDESIDWYEQALVLCKSLGARTPAAKTLGNLGWSYYRLGDYENALSLFTQAERESKRLGLTKDELLWQTNIGSVLYSEGDYLRAEDNYRSSLAMARALDNKAAIAECLNNLAFVAIEESKLNEAEEYNHEALELERAGQDHFGELYSFLVEARIAAGKKDYARAERIFQEVSRSPNAELPLRWEAQAGLAGVYYAKNLPGLADSRFQKSIEMIGQARSSLPREEFRLSFLSTAIGLYDDYVEFLVSQKRNLQALKIADLSRARALAEGLGLRSSIFSLKRFRPQQVSRDLNTVILYYWLARGRSYLWAITPVTLTLVPLPPAAEIDSLVQSYRESLLGPRDVLETKNRAGQKLYEILIAPVKSLMPKGSRVAILPDGSLFGLNFETLLVRDPQWHYWIEDVTIVNSNSLALLSASVRSRPARARRLLLIGNPVSPNSEFPPLSQAALEMGRVEQYFTPGQRTVFFAEKATPEAYLRSKPEQFSFIHFVAHGTASRTRPLDSAIILTQEGTTSTYKLYARDVIAHSLQAQLVTISACHGEGTRSYSGEGLIGLSWAFLRAGAHNVIAALWEVNDASTPQLMDRLYSEISRGKVPEEALRDAKVAMLHSNTVYRRPFYWAPFQLYVGS